MMQTRYERVQRDCASRRLGFIAEGLLKPKSINLC